MPAEFQNAVDLTLKKCKSTLVFLGDISVFTKGKKADHQLALRTVLNKINGQKLATSGPKCNFACKQVEWLGFIIKLEETGPLIEKTEEIELVKAPKMYKQLKNFMDLIHHLTKNIPNLAALTPPFRPNKTKKHSRK